MVVCAEANPTDMRTSKLTIAVVNRERFTMNATFLNLTTLPWNRWNSVLNQATFFPTHPPRAYNPTNSFFFWLVASCHKRGRTNDPKLSINNEFGADFQPLGQRRAPGGGDVENGSSIVDVTSNYTRAGEQVDEPVTDLAHG